jgi:glycosylphosphatidylinositol transamidase (GPIT) subunit GPI8
MSFFPLSSTSLFYPVYSVVLRDHLLVPDLGGTCAIGFWVLSLASSKDWYNYEKMINVNLFDFCREKNGEIVKISSTENL